MSWYLLIIFVPNFSHHNKFTNTNNVVTEIGFIFYDCTKFSFNALNKSFYLKGFTRPDYKETPVTTHI